MVETARPDRIVVGLSERWLHAPVVELLELRFAGYAVEEAASAYERIQGRVSLKGLRPSQLMESGEFEPRPQSVLYQRLWNAFLAAVGIALTAPIMAMAALAVKLSSPGPVLDRQARAGLHDAVFTLYKFRSARTGPAAGPVSPGLAGSSASCASTTCRNSSMC